MDLNSDPHAWIRPIFAALKAEPAYFYLSPSHQFARLCEAIGQDHPAKAAVMCEWTPAAQDAFLKWLRDITDEVPAVRDVELWRVQKASRELRCVAVYLPTGIDLRLMEGQDFRRTQLVKDAPEADAKSQAWREALIERAWTVTGPILASHRP
jgi:hypothetical protein